MRTFLCIAIIAAFPAILPAAPPELAGVKIYDADPSHLWNRLHQTLFVRTAIDGATFGRDSLDPPLYAESIFFSKAPLMPKPWRCSMNS